MKTIIEMAREAGFSSAVGKHIALDKELEAFAALVRADERDKWMERTVILIRGEREACAKLCEQHGYDHYCGNVTDKIAETIRSRSNT